MPLALCSYVIIIYNVMHDIVYIPSYMIVSCVLAVINAPWHVELPGY